MTDLRQAAQALLNRWDSPLWKNGSTADAIAALRTALEQHQAEPVADEWAKLLHYPDCWDTAAYPALHDAVHEALAWSGCSVCKLAQQAEPVAVVDEVIHAAWSAGYVEGERAVMEQQVEPVMLNGLTEAETNAAASVTGLTKQAEPVAVYGYCPVCGAKGVTRERRPNGNDKCTNGHTYPSSTALKQQVEPVAKYKVTVIDDRHPTGVPLEQWGKKQNEPCQFCGLVQCDPRCMWIQKDIGVEQAEPVACKTLCELCVKRGYDFCANVAKTTPIIISPTPPQQQAEPVQEPFEDLATELFVVAQRSPADDGFSDTIDRIESWLREHFSTQPQRKSLTDELEAAFKDGWQSAKAAHGIKENT